MAAEVGRRPRLLYLVTSFNNGGAEWGLPGLIERGAFDGFDLTVAALVRGAGAQVDALAALAQPPVILNDARRLTPGALILAAVRLRALLARTRPEALVLSLPHANLLGRLLRPTRPAPLIVSFEHNSRLARRAYEVGYRLTSGRVDWALADCAATATAALHRNYRRPPARTDVLPLAAFEPRDPRLAARASSDDGGPARLVSAGRLSRAKDQGRMLAILAGLRAEGLHARLTLYGEGPRRATLLAEAGRLGVADEVEFAGQTKDWWVRPADLFLMTSRHEGLCLAALEAMAAGLPVAATPAGGLADYGPEAGVLELGPDDGDNARAVAALLRDPPRLEAMRRAGREMVERRFSEASVRAACRDFALRLRQAVEARRA